MRRLIDNGNRPITPKPHINTDAIDENLLIASIGKSKIGTTTASILDGADRKSVV